jgi:hypothetical protein
MKKIYEIPTIEVMTVTAEAILEASLHLIDENATGPGMSREFPIFDEIIDEE